MKISDLEQTTYMGMPVVQFYIGMLSRENHDNPQFKDDKFFTTSEQAHEYVKKLDERVGYCPVVWKAAIKVRSFKKDEEFEIMDLKEKKMIELDD